MIVNPLSLEEKIVSGDVITYRFTYKDANGDAVNMTGSTFQLTIHEKMGDAPVVTKADGDFGKGAIANGIVTVQTSSADNTRTGPWFLLLRTTYSSGDIRGQWYTQDWLPRGT